MDLFDQKCFNIYRLHLLLFGLWPYQRKIIAIATRICITILYLHCCFVELCFMIESRNNMYVLIETLPFFLANIVVVIWYTNSLVKLEMFKEMLDRIQYDWHCATTSKEVRILEAHMKDAWKWSVYYLGSVYLLLVSYTCIYITLGVLDQLVTSNITIALRPKHKGLFLDPDVKFSFILLYINLFMVMEVIAVVTGSLQFNILCTHACGMFSIFGNRLEHAFHDHLGIRIKDNRVQIDFTRIIQQHEQIIQYVNTVNTYYSGSHCFQALVGCMLISSILVNICINIKNFKSLHEIVLSTEFFVGSIINMLSIVVSGQQLINVSSHVFRQTYCGEWYNASISNQKTLLLIMCKCMQPASVAYANLFTISSEAFAMILHASMSYFTVLYSLQ